MLASYVLRLIFYSELKSSIKISSRCIIENTVGSLHPLVRQLEQQPQKRGFMSVELIQASQGLCDLCLGDHFYILELTEFLLTLLCVFQGPL